MATSQNGWPVDHSGAGQDRAPLLRDITVPNGVRRGDVATVFRWLAREYDRRVERLKPGWCWGWYVKPIEGTTVVSNHASGTAVDFNAPDNPMARGSTEKSLTAAQIAQCHALERESDGVLRWGGDFTRDDPMHWEIVGSAAEVAALARRISREADTVTEQEIINAVVKALRSDGGKAAMVAIGRNHRFVSDTDRGAIGADAANRLLPALGRIERALGLEAAEVPPTAEENAAAVVRALGAGDLEQTAAALRTVLGDRAAAVGRLLAAE